jgi:hypothetical protein
MKSSATACFETPWAVGIITLVRKIFIAHDRRPGMEKETGLGWNDVLTMEILVPSNCVGNDLAIRFGDLAIQSNDLEDRSNDLAIRFVGSIWQIDLAIWQFNLPDRFAISICHIDLAIRFGSSIWRFKFILGRFGNSIRQNELVKLGKTNSIRRFGNSIRKLDSANELK